MMVTCADAELTAGGGRPLESGHGRGGCHGRSGSRGQFEVGDAAVPEPFTSLSASANGSSTAASYGWVR